MSQQQRFIQLSLVGTILLGFLVGVYLFAWKRVPKPNRSAKVVKHHVETSADEALKYWTADKMRKAKATNMPSTDALEPSKPHQQHPPERSNSHDS
jgi:hypothetical protein